jgi:S-DNA-T family DNA segregation ATPase FtsK/SpoIIIE
MKQIPQGIPEDPRLKDLTPEAFTLPAFLQFPNKISLLIKAHDEGRAPAVQALQAAMLRFLTAVPPGKVRFTIVDPVGLGQNFSTFMNLKDVDELLVNSRIWTEQQQIDQRLLDLTEHMENVIQTYLRNEYASIEEYNVMAGEVAEPYRVLVAANYPANFSDTAQRRLVSIAQSGPRCGVYVLVSLDTKLQNATNQLAKDLEPSCVNLTWKDNRFIWKDSPFEQYPLLLDVPPADAELNRIVKLAGEAAKAAKRVEVPFEVIAPSRDKYWTWDSRTIVDVPMGRAGATKFQSLTLGRGTSQHVLIAGKTGSGKSTLLHAMITNAALMYSPKELELYLIDFKKGVEFKTYAAHGLPHARVIAVESEREFGLSVLQRLDVELKRRGEMYRVVNAQDVAGYRRLTGEYLPRILLLVDEFQEFFIEDDKLSQESSLLLDRLVRQGRAFGIHVTLGSQTLGGAYSLARTTIAQMAIRIALQCSEADSHLILSEDNAAARLLTRPGEAIYNDANGMIEGNHIFQVVWLNDDKREEYIKDLKQMAEERGLLPDTPQLVFEGNLPAVVDRNPLLNQALAAPTWEDDVKAATAWVGDAIAIKDPTCVVFRRQAGSHVLLIGQQDEAALGIMTTMLVSLATQHADPGTSEIPNGARFYILDGSPPDSPNLGVLARLADVIPHPFQTAGNRDYGPIMTELSEELARRQADEHGEYPSLYLTIFDLGRFRDLRKSDDDFGFSSRGSDDEKPKPAKILTDILREGPNFGIFVIAWCDTVGNLNRTFERSAAGEFELRILFQMSINDSSALIDSPAAGRLGENRGLYFNEEQGKTEKFRPYGLPDQSWLDRAREQLHAKAKPAGYSDAPRPPKGDQGDVEGEGDEYSSTEPPSFSSSFGPGPGPINLPPIARPADLAYDDDEEAPRPSPAPAPAFGTGPINLPPIARRTDLPYDDEEEATDKKEANGNGQGDDAGHAVDPAGDAASG